MPGFGKVVGLVGWFGVVCARYGALPLRGAHTLPYASVLHSVTLGVVASAFGNGRQDPQVVAEDRAADGRGEILKTAKTASG